MPGQALVFTHVIALFCCAARMLKYNAFTSHTWQMPGQALVFTQVIALFPMQPGMLEYNAFTSDTWQGSGIHTGDCIVLCAAKML